MSREHMDVRRDVSNSTQNPKPKTKNSKQTMHPVIRFISLILFSLLLSRSSVPILITGFSLIIAFYVITSLNYLYDAKTMLSRMRWFFLSIIIMYFWFTPGDALFGIQSAWLPTIDGIELGLTRVFALVVIILAVNLFLKTTAKRDMMSALIWLTYPLSVFGDFQQRFAVRMTLTLEAVAQVQALCHSLNKERQKTKNPITRISAIVANVYQQVLAKAEDSACEVIEIPEPTSPPLYQWIYLPCLVVALLGNPLLV